MRVLLPFRGVESAKTRWRELGSKREDLALQMVRENLRTVIGVVGAENVFLVSPDLSLETYFPDSNIVQTEGRGLNADLSEARAYLQSRQPGKPLAVLLPDLPTLEERDVESLLEAIESYQVVLCPDHLEIGTNGIALRDPDSLDFLFEGESFQRFHNGALAAGLSTGVLRRPGLAHDCDDVEALKRFCLL